MRRTSIVMAFVLGMALITGSASAVPYGDVADGRFNASDVDTWGAGLNVYPSAASDVGNIDSNLVKASVVGEVPNGVTVNLSGTGILQLTDPGTLLTDVVHNGATVNVGAGGRFEVKQRHRVTSTINLDGGTLHLYHYTTYIRSTVNVNADSTIEGVNTSSGNSRFGESSTNPATVTGSGTLIKTGVGYVSLEWDSANTTWSGDWDVQAGKVLIPNAAHYVPGNMRIAAGATVEHTGGYSHYSGVVTGNGRWGIYRGNVVTIANGGTLSPGDSVGNMSAYSTSGGGDESPLLRLATGSTYEVDIEGTTNAEYDYFVIRGKNDGQGRIEIQSGAKLEVNLWTPAGPTPLNATVLRALTGNDDPGLVTGSFDLADITWNNSAGWRELSATVVDDHELHITGTYGTLPIPEPGALAVFGLGAGLALFRRKRSRRGRAVGRAGNLSAVVLGMSLALFAGSASAGVTVVEDWGDLNDHWGDAISYNSSRVTIDTANNVLTMFSSGSSDTHSGKAVSSYTPNVPDASYWWDLSGQGYDRFTFTYKNTGTTAQTWDGVGPSGSDNSYVGFNFKRYSDTRLNPNTVRWNLWDLIIDATGDGVVDAGETITITGLFDDYDWRSRTDMYGWDTANDRYIISGWWLRKQYDSHGANSPYELGAIVFTGAPPPPAPIPEPAGLSLLGIGLLAVRKRRS